MTWGGPAFYRSSGTLGPIAASMRAWWDFEENDAGSTFSDALGNYPLSVRNTSGAVATSASSTTGGLVNRGGFPNFSRNLYVPVANTLILPNSDWTIGLWLTGLASSSGITRFIMGNNGSGGAAYQASINISTASQVYLVCMNTSLATTVVNTLQALSTTTFSLVTASLDRAGNLLTCRIRRIGTGVTKVTGAFTGALYAGNTTDNFCINHAISNDNTYFAGTRDSVGTCDSAFVSNIAFTDAQFDSVYNATAGRNWAGMVSSGI